MSQTARASAKLDARQLLKSLPPDELLKLINEIQGKVPMPLPAPISGEPTVLPNALRSVPWVSAVMVISDKGRIRIARRAVECFLTQEYSRKTLTIINGIAPEEDLDLRVVNNPHPLIVEHAVPSGLSLGALRNIGLDKAPGEWIIQWQDDDYHHPRRIDYQMANRAGSYPVLLRRQLRINRHSSSIFYHDEPTGISSTILHPKTDKRYLDLSEDEDLLFWIETWGHDRVVVDNNDYAKLTLSFFHERRSVPEYRWMEKCLKPGRCEAVGTDFDYLKEVCGLYGLFLGIQQPQVEELAQKVQAPETC